MLLYINNIIDKSSLCIIYVTKPQKKSLVDRKLFHLPRTDSACNIICEWIIRERTGQACRRVHTLHTRTLNTALHVDPIHTRYSKSTLFKLRPFYGKTSLLFPHFQTTSIYSHGIRKGNKHIACQGRRLQIGWLHTVEVSFTKFYRNLRTSLWKNVCRFSISLLRCRRHVIQSQGELFARICKFQDASYCGISRACNFLTCATP